MFLRSTFLAAAAIVACFVNLSLAAGPAFAQTEATMVISYADLNLGNSAGRAVLERRIASAAEQLCGQFNPIELGQAEAGRACLSETIASVQPQVEAAINRRFGTVRISQADLSVRVSRAAN